MSEERPEIERPEIVRREADRLVFRTQVNEFELCRSAGGWQLVLRCEDTYYSERLDLAEVIAWLKERLED